MPDLNLSPDDIEQLSQKQMISENLKQRLLSVVPAPLQDAVVSQESGGRSDAVSPKGAQGLMQVMPNTAKEEARKIGIQNIDLTNPAVNTLLGTAYLADQKEKYKDDRLALAAYNAGPGTVDGLLKKTGGTTYDDIAPLLPKETRNYVPAVMYKYGQNLKASGTQQQPLSQTSATQAQAPSVMDRVPNFLDPAETAEAETPSITGDGKLLDDPVYLKSAGLDQNLPASIPTQAISSSPTPQQLPTTAPSTTGAEQQVPTPSAQPSIYDRMIDSQNKLNASFDEQSQAVQQGSEAAVTQANETAQAKSEFLTQSQQIEAQRQQILNAQRAALDVAQKQMSSALNEYRSTPVINVDRYWNSISTPNKVMNLIGIFCAGFKRAGDNSPNQVMEAINHTIDQDIEAQKAQLVAKGNAISLQRGIYGDMLSRFNDENTATQATKNIYMDQFNLKLGQIAASNAPAQIKSDALMLQSGIHQQQAQTSSAFINSIATNPSVILDKIGQADQGQSGTEQGQGAPQNTQLVNRMLMMNPELNAKAVRGPDGTVLGFTADPKLTEDTRNKVVKLIEGRNILSNIMNNDLVAKGGTFSAFSNKLNSSEVARLDIQKQNLISKLREIESLGSFAKGTYNVLNNQANLDPTKFYWNLSGQGPNRAIGETLMKQLNTDLSDTINSRIPWKLAPANQLIQGAKSPFRVTRR